MSKKLAVFILSISILLLSFTVPASAFSIMQIPYAEGISSYPTQAQAEALYNASLIAYSGTHNGYNYGVGVFTPDNGNIYACCLYLSGSYYVLAFTQALSQHVCWTRYNGSYEGSGTAYMSAYLPGQEINGLVSDVLGESYEGMYYYAPIDLYGLSSTEISWLTPQLPYYTTLEDGLYALVQASASSVKRYEVPVGYVMYIKASGAVTLTCTQPYISELVGQPFPYSITQALGTSSALLTNNQNISFRSPGFQSIPWAKGSPSTAGGQTYQSFAVYTPANTSDYLVIINPVTMHLLPAKYDNMVNSTIYVSARALEDPKLIPLSDTYDSYGYLQSGQSDIEGTILTQTIDETTPSNQVSYTLDSTGEPVLPTPGGSTQLPSIDSSDSNTGLIGSIQNLFSRITAALERGFTAIPNFISAGSSFMEALAGLWVWLPPDIVAVILSALIILIIVGVFHLFL